MPRLRTVSPSTKGFSRRRAGSGWTFLDKTGQRITDPDEIQRIKSLAIPPAWQDVWISPYPNGHIQAVGTDDAGRRQYLYHPDWRIKRDKMKFDRVLAAARKLPAARRAIKRDLGLEGMPLERADAVAVRLLDLGYFRIGSDIYADTNGSFGLTTLEKRHVSKDKDRLVFRFEGKSGIEHSIEIDDPEVLAAWTACAGDVVARSGCSPTSSAPLARPRLLGGEHLPPRAVRGPDRQGLPHLARDRARRGRLAASDEPGDTKRSRQRAIKSAVAEVAEYLGNTPTIAKNSYIDPRVIDLYESGTTIDPELVTKKYRSPAAKQRTLEAAVLELLS